MATVQPNNQSSIPVLPALSGATRRREPVYPEPVEGVEGINACPEHSRRNQCYVRGFLFSPYTHSPIYSFPLLPIYPFTHILFMQNEPNLRNDKMNVNYVLITNYGDKKRGDHPENKPNSNPIKPNLKSLRPALHSWFSRRRVSAVNFFLRGIKNVQLLLSAVRCSAYFTCSTLYCSTFFGRRPTPTTSTPASRRNTIWGVLKNAFVMKRASFNNFLCKTNNNLPEAQMNVNYALTTNYGDKRCLQTPENKPNTNPIQTQSKPIKPNLEPPQSGIKQIINHQLSIINVKAQSNPI